MIKKTLLALTLLTLVVSCYQPRRDCQKFKNGKFSFTVILDGEEQTTTFVRNDTMEIDYFEEKADTSSVRWINDCEYIVKKLNPENRSEEKSVHMKIVSTKDSSYVFEYGIVGESKKSRGEAIKIQ